MDESIGTGTEKDPQVDPPKCDQCAGPLIDPYPWKVRIGAQLLKFTVCGECHQTLVRKDTRDLVYPEQAKRLMSF